MITVFYSFLLPFTPSQQYFLRQRGSHGRISPHWICQPCGNSSSCAAVHSELHKLALTRQKKEQYLINTSNFFLRIPSPNKLCLALVVAIFSNLLYMVTHRLQSQQATVAMSLKCSVFYQPINQSIVY